MTRFPHLTANGNKSDFPDVSGVNVYAYDNDFDYSRYDHVQMNITLCRVPWDMGEAHIGARTISGIGNVVYFGSKEERDAWFASLPDSECYRFSTKYRELHSDNTLRVPVPFDVASTYNYVLVQHEPMASEGDYVEYEQPGGFNTWCWFIREVRFIAPNATELVLMNDAWQTFIYDLHIPYMTIERGHYGMHQVNASNYLMNPVEKCRWLTAPEENAPQPPHVTANTDALLFNGGNVFACISTSANLEREWGSKGAGTWRTPAGFAYVQGVSNFHVYAMDADRLSSFLANVTDDYPQFLQTIQGVFFIDVKYLNLVRTFSFAGTPLYVVGAGYHHEIVSRLTLDDFGYPSQYREIAKLYTYPYAVIEVTDSDGLVSEIRIEDTDGTIAADVCVNLAFPWIKIDGAITSAGRSARSILTFANASQRNMPIKGNWHDLLFSLDIPTFAVIESAAKANDHSTHFDRVQQAYAADNAQANANASADTMKANADASADTAQTNQNANATLTTDNATLTTTANTAVTNISNGSASDALDNTRTYNFDSMDTDNAITNATASAQIQAQEEQAAVTAASGAASSAVGALSSLASGNIAGAVAGLANGIIGVGSTLASTSISVHLSEAEAQIAVQNNEWHAEMATHKTEADTATQRATATSMTNAQNTLTSGTAANSAATTRANAARDNATQKANASRDQATQKANAARDRDTVAHAISNQIAQAALDEPLLWGNNANGDHATTRPLALFSNIVTQDAGTVRRFGDDFLRYGYSLNQQITFDGNWCLMPKFTYWRLADFWVEGLNVPDMYVDKIRFFLYGGVTVWRKPEEIGRVSLYDNIERR